MLRAIVDDEKSTISSTISLRVRTTGEKNLNSTLCMNGQGPTGAQGAQAFYLRSVYMGTLKKTFYCLTSQTVRGRSRKCERRNARSGQEQVHHQETT